MLEWVESDKKADITVTGADFGGNTKENLVFKAYKLLQKDFQLPPITIHLHKIIPSGAGLGGGSADAAFMLNSLNSYFDLYLDEELMEDYAAQLGSDCPFFIKNEPQIATGRGEILTPIDIDLKGWYLTLVKPEFSVPTAKAYAGVQPQQPEHSLVEIIRQPVNSWKEILKNDFEESVFAQYPEIRRIKEQLYELGAAYASMSGSGSSVFALSEKPLPLDKFRTYKIFSAQL